VYLFTDNQSIVKIDYSKLWINFDCLADKEI
jgi:hypothetical protein